MAENSLEQLKRCRLLVPDANPMGLAQSPLGQCSATVRSHLVTKHRHAIAPGIVRIDIVGQGSVYMLDMEAAQDLKLEMEGDDGEEQD